MSTTVENQRKLLVAAGIVIAILMGIVAMLLFNKFGQDKTIDTQEKEINKVYQLNKELQEEYDNAMAELDEAMAENEQHRETIEQLKADLTARKSKISKMIRAGKTDEKALQQAKEELEQLRLQQQANLAKIDELEQQNSLLTNEIVQVKEEKKVVEEEVVKQRTEKDSVIAAKEVVVKEKETLEKEKEFLEGKVDLGSIIKVNNINVTGYKLKSGGKLVKKRYAKNIDVLKICYTATDNRVAEPGTEQFLMRVVTPLGTTMFVENLGSGVFVNKDTQEQMRFTKAQDVPYKNESTDQCLNWKPDTPFAKGIYKVEIFNKGYFAGRGEFQLK